MTALEIVTVIAAASGVNVVLLLVGMFKLGGAVKTFELIGKQQSEEIKQLKVSMEKITDILREQALQTQRTDTIETRINRAMDLIEEIRHGEGFILPLSGRSLPSKG